MNFVFKGSKLIQRKTINRLETLIGGETLIGRHYEWLKTQHSSEGGAYFNVNP